MIEMIKMILVTGVPIPWTFERERVETGQGKTLF